MWTCVWFIAACAVYAAGDATPNITQTLNIGENLETTITTIPNNDFKCNLETPAKEIIQFLPENQGDPSKYEFREPNIVVGCAVSVLITGPEDNGLWKLFFELENGTVDSQTYDVTVKGSQDSIENVPSTTEEAEKREIEFLEGQTFHTHIGAVHKISITKYDFVSTESCHLVSPNGDEYTSSVHEISGLKWIEDKNEACGVEINVDGEDMVGNWTLFSKAIRHSILIEKRQPFAIYVEEYVKASPEEVTIAVGNNLHIRLVNTIPYNLQNTCSFIGPKNYSIDENHIDTCGFIVKDIQAPDNGTWHIVFGNKIIYRASIEVTVTGDVEFSNTNLKWIADEPVDVLVGPENAVYCRVQNPAGRTVSETFGRCHITLDSATKLHNGNWILTVGLPGRITTDSHWIFVHVLEADPRPTVITHVEKQNPEVLLGCVLPGDHQVQTCKFRDPHGRVLLAPEGVGEDEFTAHGVNISLASNVNTTSCGLRIKNPTTTELGLWRCAMETADGDVYYGFLSVLCPWALQDESVAAAVITEPTLTAYEVDVWGQEGEVTLACSIQSAIKYCYFRARNGTVFNISPGLSTDGMEYVGAGFEAGECGVKMMLQVADSGMWSCHVGLVDQPTEEQRVDFIINIQPILTAFQYSNENALVLHGRIFAGRSLDYCRYVRIDGLGFTDDNLPDGYNGLSDLHNGVCELIIQQPSILDHHPWTIVTRVHGQHMEVSAVTQATLTLPPQPPGPGTPQSSRGVRIWILFILLSVVVVFFALAVTDKRSRNWTSRKTTALRSSFRFKNWTQPKNTNTSTANPPVYTA